MGELRLPSELTRHSRMWTPTSKKGGQSRAVSLGQDPQKRNLQTRPKTQPTLLSFVSMRLLESSLYLSKYHFICSQGAFLESSNTQILVLRPWSRAEDNLHWDILLPGLTASIPEAGLDGAQPSPQRLEAFPFTSFATLERNSGASVSCKMLTSGTCLWKYC